MSKLARKPIDTSSLDVSLVDQTLSIKGRHGTLNLAVSSDVTVTVLDNSLTVDSKNRAKLGLYCALIKNMVNGVSNTFSQHLTLKGVGYRVSLANNVLNFNLGYSHPVTFTLPDGISAELPTQTEIKLTGIDKQLLGQVAADILKLRPAKKDPYKEKGIKRIQDRIIKKVGKKVK